MLLKAKKVNFNGLEFDPKRPDPRIKRFLEKNGVSLINTPEGTLMTGNIPSMGKINAFLATLKNTKPQGKRKNPNELIFKGPTKTKLAQLLEEKIKRRDTITKQLTQVQKDSGRHKEYTDEKRKLDTEIRDLKKHSQPKNK